jgi:hypothetical protein
MPVRSTKRMPFSAARSSTRGRPPRGCGGTGGSSGATTAQSSSDTNARIAHLSAQSHSRVPQAAGQY